MLPPIPPPKPPPIPEPYLYTGYYGSLLARDAEGFCLFILFYMIPPELYRSGSFVAEPIPEP